jgi:hypothetical protein
MNSLQCFDKCDADLLTDDDAEKIREACAQDVEQIHNGLAALGMSLSFTDYSKAGVEHLNDLGALVTFLAEMARELKDIEFGHGPQWRQLMAKERAEREAKQAQATVRKRRSDA